MIIRPAKSYWKILLIISGPLILYPPAPVGGFDRHPTTAAAVEETEDQAHPEEPVERQTRIETYKLRQENIRQEIEKGRQEVEAITRKEADIIKRLNRVDLAFNKSKKRAALLSQEISRLENEISDASHTTAELRERLRINEAYVAKRLVAMYKMTWLGTIDMLASAESIQEFIQRKAALEHILAYDEKIRDEMMRNQAELEKVLERLEKHRTQKNEKAEEYKIQIRQMSEEQSIRQKLLADIRDQKALELAAIDAVTQAAED